METNGNGEGLSIYTIFAHNTFENIVQLESIYRFKMIPE